MAPGRRIPEATVARLPLYLRVLGEASGHEATISSESLAARAGVNAAQVRYEVDYLIRQISRRLGLDGERRVAIVGCGNLGQALAGYGGFPARGFHVVAAFDADPSKVGSLVGSTVVQPAAAMLEVLPDKGVDIAVITTPAAAAQAVVDTLVEAGVACILNFAPTTVTVPAHVALRQVDLGIELQILSFYQQSIAVRT
jgi:redox-sensing transcriptional repressor